MESYTTYENLEAGRAEYRRLSRLYEREQEKNEAILQAIENSNHRIDDLKREVKELRKARIRANKARLCSALEAEVEAAITAAAIEMQNNLEVSEINSDNSNHPLPRSSSSAATTNDLFSSHNEEHHNPLPPPPSSMRTSFGEWMFFTFKWLLMIFGILICLFIIFLIGQWIFMSIYTGSLLAFSGYRAPLIETRYEPIYVYRGWSLPYWSFSWGYAFGGYDNYYHSHDTYNVWNSNANEPRSRGWFSWSDDDERPSRGWFSREESEPPRKSWFSWSGNDPEEPRSSRGWFSREEMEPRKSWFSWRGNDPEPERSSRRESPPPPSYSSHEPEPAHYYNDDEPSSGPELRGSPSSGSF